MTHTIELFACFDCLCVIANDEFPHDAGPERVQEIADGIQREGEMVPGDGEHDRAFSWQPCDVCHRPLGGSRHQVFSLVRA